MYIPTPRGLHPQGQSRAPNVQRFHGLKRPKPLNADSFRISKKSYEKGENRQWYWTQPPWVCTYVHIHTRILTYYLRAYLLSYLPAYLPIYLPTYQPTDLATYIRTLVYEVPQSSSWTGPDYLGLYIRSLMFKNPETCQPPERNRRGSLKWGFPKIGVAYSGALTIRSLIFRVLH